MKTAFRIAGVSLALLLAPFETAAQCVVESVTQITVSGAGHAPWNGRYRKDTATIEGKVAFRKSNKHQIYYSGDEWRFAKYGDLLSYVASREGPVDNALPPRSGYTMYGNAVAPGPILDLGESCPDPTEALSNSNSCPELSTESGCLAGKDNRRGKSFSDSACAWCCGDACHLGHGGSAHKCQPTHWLLSHPSGIAPMKNGIGYDTCPSEAPSNTPTEAPSSVPTDAPTDAPTTNAPTNAPTDVPTDAPTNAPTKLRSCKYHSQCNAGDKCKGFWNVDKMCRKRETDCKLRGTKHQKKWGCSAGEKCDPNLNEKWNKWGTCMSV